MTKPWELTAAILAPCQSAEDGHPASDTEVCQGARPDASATPGPGGVGPTIMIVDDEPTTVRIVRRYLRDEGYQRFVACSDPLRATSALTAERPDLLLLDLMMPRIGGLEILEVIRDEPRTASIPVIILTAATDRETRLHALRAGATDFLQKPVDPSELVARVRNLLTVKAYQDHLRDHSKQLEEVVRARTAALEDSRRDIVRCLARAAEFRDDDTGQHIMRVGRYARLIGEALGMDRDALDLLEQAAQLHDVGKIGIPDAILQKPGRLTSDEYARMKKHCGHAKHIIGLLPPESEGRWREHTEIGARILDSGRSDLLRVAMRIALTHHERWDGSGYPLGLEGEDIPLEGRITAVADVFDALSSRRPYKEAMPLDRCFEILSEGRGSHFDPRMLDAFFARREQVVRVQIAYADTD